MPHEEGAQASPSLILALHDRYEQAWQEYHEIDLKKPRKASELPEGERSIACINRERGKVESFQETSLIRNTICYQIPTTDEEAAILIHHVWVMIDESSGVYLEELSLEEKQSLEQSINSVFIYLACRGTVDAAKIGPQFSRHAMLAVKRRRYRTGMAPAD